MQKLWRNCWVLKHRHHFSEEFHNLSTYPVLGAIPLSTISIIIVIVVLIIFSSSSSSNGDAVHATWSQAAAAAGRVKGVWLEPLTVMIHNGGCRGAHGEYAHCVSGFGGAKLNWNMIYCRWNLPDIISQETLEWFGIGHQHNFKGKRNANSLTTNKWLDMMKKYLEINS